MQGISAGSMNTYKRRKQEISFSHKLKLAYV